MLGPGGPSALESESSLTDGKSTDVLISCWVKGRERVSAGLDVLHPKRKVGECFPWEMSAMGKNELMGIILALIRVKEKVEKG